MPNHPLAAVVLLVAAAVLAGACSSAELVDAAGRQVGSLSDQTVAPEPTVVVSDAFVATATDAEVQAAVALFVDRQHQ